MAQPLLSWLRRLRRDLLRRSVVSVPSPVSSTPLFSSFCNLLNTSTIFILDKSYNPCWRGSRSSAPIHGESHSAVTGRKSRHRNSFYSPHLQTVTPVTPVESALTKTAVGQRNIPSTLLRPSSRLPHSVPSSKFRIP